MNATDQLTWRINVKNANQSPWKMMRKDALLWCMLLAAGCSNVATAQPAYPSKPIRLVHGFLAGGNVDLNARLIAAPMSEIFGQPILVEGRPGAGGTVGAAHVARSEADGYTLFLAAAGHSSSPSLYRSLPYDAVTDFTFITLISSNPYLVIIHPSFPGHTIQQLVQIAKRQSGKLDYATGGVGTGMHLVSLLFQSQLDLKMNHVPYRGGTATPAAVAGGEVPVMFGTPGEVQPLVDGGRLRVIAVTSKERWHAWPNTPTLDATVLPGFNVTGWSAILGPAKLTPAVVSRLNEAARMAMKRPDVAEKFRAKGSDPIATDPDYTRKFVAGEVARWNKTIKEAGIPLQN
jgi:tripartite-type tricarboxylate transporter receptor subunit TctC